MAQVKLSEKLLATLETKQRQEEFYDEGFNVSGSFGVRINQGGKKSFFLIYPFNGRRTRVTLGVWPLVDLNTAKDRAMRLVRLASRGRNPKKFVGKSRVKDTFGDLVGLFMERHAKEKCSSRTMNEYRRIIEVDLLPNWEEFRVEDIDRRLITQLIDGIAVGRGSPVMAKRTAALISKIFSFAASEGFIDKNPLKGFSAKVSLPMPEPVRILADAEIRQLWKTLEQESVLIEGLFKLLLLTGQRIGDVLAMRWDELRLDEWRKSGDENFRCYFGPLAIEILKRIREQSVSAGEFVFQSGSSSHLKHIRKAVRRIAVAMNAEQAWSARDLRQTVRANLFKLGISAEIIARLLNNESEWRRVPEIDSAKVQQATALWSRELAKIVDRKVMSIVR